ncbi:hypothetical protein CKO28_00600 [Rhodovibrio sodomensis]|uniref:DUF4031 domain-containing protein n=1 Tax=Rhodovibrio sodomensis TaxID=1088 RepID=A0ABS1D876_9PROT|nr:DUF4031 domain-containing protein [Rhodovibrio sodomensis]MBK1666540.1 hypothetical protein [Rhodovibrio sodomensis]
MAVYVDRWRQPYRGMLMCHMLADSIDELHAMADRLGLKRAWFQNKPGQVPHYDVCWSNRQKAVKLGAVEVGMRDTACLVRRWRVARQSGERAIAPPDPRPSS